MGKKSKQAPAAPDYAGIAKQQAADQAKLLEQQTQANRPNQTNPYGSVNWSQGPDGQWTQNVTMNQAEQSQLDANRGIQKGLTDTAGGLLGQAQNSLSNPLSTAGLPAWGSYDPSKLSAGGDASQLNNGVGPLQSQLKGINPIQGKVGNAGAIQQGVASSLGKSGADTYGAQGHIQGGGYGGGNIDYSKLGDFGSMKGYANQNNMDAGFGAVAPIQKAMMDLNAPYRQQARNDEIMRLKAQGITENSPAWTRAIQRLDTGDTAAQNQALLGATTEYGNIFNRGLQQNTQNFGQGMDVANLTDRQRAQRLQEQATQGQFDEGRASRSMQSDIAGAQLNSQNQNQLYQQALQGGQFANAAQNQQFGQNLQGGEFANQAQNQGYNQALGGANLNNAAVGQQFGQNLQQQNLAGVLRQQGFGEQGQMANYNNAVRGGMLNEQQALRQSPLNDLRSLMGSNPQAPAFQQFMGAGQQQAPDLMGAANQDYQARMNAYNAQQAQRSGLMGGLFGLAGSALGGPLGGMAGNAIGGLFSPQQTSYAPTGGSGFRA